MNKIFQELKNTINRIFEVLIYQPSPERKENFVERNPAQSDDDFISICFISPSDKAQKVALAIRSAIAKLGEIDREFIRAEICFEELDALPFWDLCGDAGFNTSRFVEAIESELGCKFTEKQLELATVRDPDLNVQMKIYEFIQEFYDWYNFLTEVKPGK